MKSRETVSGHQQALQAVLAETRAILGDAEIGAEDSFFAIGGTSLDCVELTSRLQSQHQLQVDLEAVFSAQSLAEIALAARPCQP
jgi:acyl carrier protein